MRIVCLLLVLLAPACGNVDNDLADAGYPDAESLCGNYVVDPGEDCDGMTTATCDDGDLNAGHPRCTSSCEIAYDTCSSLTLLSMDIHGDLACASTEEQGLDCWGETQGGVAEEPVFGELHNLTACYDSLWCGLTASGEISCRDYLPVGLPRGPGYQRIGCDHTQIWAVTMEGKLTLGNPDLDSEYSFLDGFELVDFYPAIDCGLVVDGQVVCADPDRQARLADWRVSQLTYARRQHWQDNATICGVTFAGEVVCVSEGNEQELDIPVTESPVARVYPVEDWAWGPVRGACTLDTTGRFVCSDGIPLLNMPPDNLRFDAVETTRIYCESEGVCGLLIAGLDTDGDLHVFGSPAAYHTSPGPFTELAADKVIVAKHQNGDVHSASLYWENQADDFW